MQELKRSTIPRVGILTYHFSDNYGACLQAYGLRQWLLKNGAEAEFINYVPRHVEAGGRLQSPFSKTGLKANLKVAFLWLSRLKQDVFGNADQRDMFKTFQEETLGVTGERLTTAEAVQGYLGGKGAHLDMLVCGSDQIWAASLQNGIDPVYYLSFPDGSPKARRISYAPSFGRAGLDPVHHNEVSGYLSAFEGLSAREKSGVKLVHDLTGREAAWVPDPTILLGDFSEFLEEHEAEVQGDHVFCYGLRTASGIREAAEAAGKFTGSPVLSPFNPHRRWREVGTTIYPSPAQWVTYLAKSKFVVTNSFHGTVFSILFRKPFITVELPGARSELNERSRSLLNALGLEERLVNGTDAAQVQEMLNRPIDWNEVSPRLEAMQKAGRMYLKNELLAVS
ncbi:polysaccharide pyruvyl transferase family protein [Alphaproteobacteria bacterium KMM 3653]|uniref:Polysaccharide pyruvyl transferase family protein n=1 Tax=Harenicola maris TaxID=2841044 RepID=A0AAP2CTG0_9RHOB|nr:polysaccharide pyruvyl transferase family protein [Harenicola maris]